MLKLRCRLVFVLTTCMAIATCCVGSDQLVIPHVTVTGCAIDTAHANALAETLATAREIYAGWGFSMPEVVNLLVTCKEGASSNLFNDGNDRLFLTIPSLAALAPPAKSGISNVYGMCHELGHIAMYRTLKDRDWMNDAAAEGWADYIGSVVVDRVFDIKGPSLWPEPYDYRADGSIRLRKDIAAQSPSEMTTAAAQWQALSAIIGLRQFPRVFAEWQSAGIDPVSPSERLLAVLDKLQPRSQPTVNDWWRGAAPVLVRNLEVSEFHSEQTSPADLSGQTVKVPPNSGTETSRMSIAGAGEGRRFTIPGAGDWYIVAVSIYGARYGEEKPPDTTFDIALCDAEGKLISIRKGRYASFPYVKDGWAHFEVPPTRVPPAFYVTLNFRATASSGVYVAFDSATKRNSIDSLPGKPPRAFLDGDWMIRIEMDHKK